MEIKNNINNCYSILEKNNKNDKVNINENEEGS